MLKGLIFLHRWLGVALCLLFLLWFSTGIVLMYWDYPGVRAEDRLARSAALDASQIRLTPAEAFAALAARQAPAQVRLSLFDGRPVYRFRSGRTEKIVYADSGEEQREVSAAMAERIGSAWTGLPSPQVESIREADQWTLEGALWRIQPLWKFSWPNGEQVYVSGASGDVVQYTTTRSRFWAYLGAIPHWLYFTPLRKHATQWSRVVIWSSGTGTFAAILGLVIGVWIYSPAASIPYQGPKRWHMILGLIFGIGAATWAFSGMLSIDPFPGTGRNAQNKTDIAGVLRGRLQLSTFDSKHPREALAQLSGVKVKELELVSFAREPVYLATIAQGDTRAIPVTDTFGEFGSERIIAAIRRSVPAADIEAIGEIRDYDVYYIDRHHQRPLPVVLVRLTDEDHTRYYIDSATARIAGAYNDRSWMSRWLYHGLHSLDFPWLYKYRPLWDIVVLTFMLGGISLCVTSVILAWQVLRRTLSV